MSEEQEIKTEVCVIGGGPAGSITALSLARLGHEVCLLERAAFPRPHVGESLSPSIFPLFDALNLRERIESPKFIRTSRPPVIRWTGQDEPIEARPHVPGLIVDRAEFDRLILTSAKEAGVEIIQPAQAATPLPDESGGWTISARGATKNFLIKARFVVDAAGRSSLLKGRRKRTSVPTLALYGYWQNSPYSRTQMLVEAGPDEWYWGSPVPVDLFNAMVFIDPKRCVNNSNAIESLYLRLLEKSSLMRDCLRGKLVTGVHACSSSSFYDAECVAKNFIKVGEASFAVDPLSSQGIQVALQSAVHGAIVVHTLLRKPEYSKAAFEFYRTRQMETVERLANTTTGFYSEQKSFQTRPFWARRSQRHSRSSPSATSLKSDAIPIDRPLRITRTLRFRDTPVIDGNIIRYQPALNDPHLNRPVAFIQGFDVETLFAALKHGATVPQVIQSWTERMTRSQSLEILQWLWSRNLIVMQEREFSRSIDSLA